MSGGGDGNDFIQEQDRFLPIANVARIMKRVVPPSGKLSKESKECVQECVTEFIQFIVSEASEKCNLEKRKTITCEDLLQALAALSFDPYVDVLKTYIERYRAAVKNMSAENGLQQQIILDPKVEPIPSSVNNNVTASTKFTTTQAAATSLQAVQVYVDNDSGQHYMIAPGPNGANTLIPVTLNMGPENDGSLGN